MNAEACARGDDFYVDPVSGLWVSTRLRLERQGGCCRQGCRHCPYTPRHGGPIRAGKPPVF